MSPNEAIGALKLINLKGVHPFYDWEEMLEVRDIAINALEKQIPKKPIDAGYYYMCPCCRCDLGVSDDDIFIYELSMPKYCSNCGCVLDWSEVKNNA